MQDPIPVSGARYEIEAIYRYFMDFQLTRKSDSAILW